MSSSPTILVPNNSIWDLPRHHEKSGEVALIPTRMERWELTVVGDQRKWNKPGKRGKSLTKKLNLFISEKMYDFIGDLIEQENFPTRSEYVRFLIRNDMDKRGLK